MSEPICLLKNEVKLLQSVRKKPRDISQFNRILRRVPHWRVLLYVEQLEETYGLIEELTPEELRAFRSGADYISLEPSDPTSSSGFYTLTRAGYLALEALREQHCVTLREWCISISSAIIGGLIGVLAVLLQH